MQTLHEITIKNIDGQATNLSKSKGKVCLVVNVACQCGYTPQYKGLKILGFPSNDFVAQEPGSESQIKPYDTIF
jgi:glutathione peroxidase